MKAGYAESSCNQCWCGHQGSKYSGGYENGPKTHPCGMPDNMSLITGKTVITQQFLATFRRYSGLKLKGKSFSFIFEEFQHCNNFIHHRMAIVTVSFFTFLLRHTCLSVAESHVSVNGLLEVKAE